MKRKGLVRLLAAAVMLLFAGVIFSFINSFCGNPVSAAIATSKIKSYVEETYPGMDFEIPGAAYNFKFHDYYSQVKSETSKDTCFYVNYSGGRFEDTYEVDVVKRRMTFNRLQSELDNSVSDIIDKEFPYETSILFAEFIDKGEDSSKLSLDMPFELSNLPYPVSLTAYVLTEDVNYDALKARLLELSDIMQAHGIPVVMYDLVLEQPAPEGEKAAVDGESLYLYDFPADKLEEPDLIQAMKAHIDQWDKEHNK